MRSMFFLLPVQQDSLKFSRREPAAEIHIATIHSLELSAVYLYVYILRMENLHLRVCNDWHETAGWHEEYTWECLN